jgi:hypothetical protein
LAIVLTPLGSQSTANKENLQRHFGGGHDERLFKPRQFVIESYSYSTVCAEGVVTARVSKGERIEIDVAITSRLLPQESIIYDFAHDELG